MRLRRHRRRPAACLNSTIGSLFPIDRNKAAFHVARIVGRVADCRSIHPAHGMQRSLGMAIDLKSLNHNQLSELIVRARARQQELVKEKTAKLRDKINALVKAEGFGLDEVLGRSASRVGKTRGKVKPKYRNPADPAQTWTGRGKRPRWFNAALSAGRKEKDLLIG
jgi:DNA-binding protein H-NS